MKEKILKIILIFILIMTLIMADFIIVGQSIVIALAEGSELLNVTTNVNNVEFNAYFKDGNTSTYNKQSIVSEGDHLVLMVTVKEVGALENGKIKIDNSNFRLQEVQNEYIKNINIDTNEIELNQIIAGNMVEINVPIVFEKVNELSKEYISQDTKVIFTGDYKNDKNASKKITSERMVKISWRENTEISINQDVDKYIYLENDVTLLQQKVNSKVANNTLVHGKFLEVAVPEIEGILPERVDVLINGAQFGKEKYIYDEQNKVVTIQNMNNNGENDEYKIIYYYPRRFKEEELSVSLKAKLKVLLYTDEVIEKDNVKETQITQVDNRVSVNVDATNSIYKGYLYVNSNKNTSYQENISTEISTLEGIGNIEIGQMQDYLSNESGIKSSVNGTTFIKSIKFTKSNLESILGNDFSVSIFVDNDKIINEINKESEWNDKGELSISLEEQLLEKVRIVCSQPTNIGTLQIEMEKYIKGATGYNREQLKFFNSLINDKIVSVGERKIPVSSTISLEDTCTEARIEISNSNLSVLNPNENVQILAILKSDSEKYDLYKNPYVEIKLPDELQEINVHSVNILYNDGLNATNSVYDSNTRTIRLQFEGEQIDFRTEVEEGIQIVINADLTFKKNVPNMKSAITMLFRNENAGELQYETSADIELNSRYGAILYSNVSGFNGENTVLESADSEVLQAQLDVDGEQRKATVNQSFINNYDAPIEQIIVVGSLSEDSSNFDAGLIHNVVTDSENSQVYYSNEENAKAEADSWQESIENLQEVKSYKIILNKELQPSESMNMTYQVGIPAQLGEGAETVQSTKVSYSLNGQLLDVSSGIELYTEGMKTTGTGVTTENEGIKTEIVAISANKELTDGEEIFEGQPVKYTVNVTNNTGKDLNHLGFVAEHSNVVYYVEKREKAEVTDNPDNPEIIVKTERDESAENVTKSLEILKNGETATFTYEFAPKKKDGIDIVGSIKIKADDLEEKAISTITNKIKDAKIAVEVLNDFNESFILHEEDMIPFRFNISNYSNEEQKDIILNIQTSDEIFCSASAKQLEEDLQDLFDDGSKIEVIEYEQNTLKIKIPKIGAQKELGFNLIFECGKILSEEVIQKGTIYCTAELGDTTYYSNTLARDLKRVTARVTANQEVDIKDSKVKIGDKIVYTAYITNSDTQLDANEMQIEHKVTEGNAKIEKAYLKRENGEIIDATISGTNKAVIEYALKAGEKVQYIAEVLVWNNPGEDVNYDDMVRSYISLSWEEDGVLDLEAIENEIEIDNNDDYYGDDDDDDNEDDNTNNSDNNNNNNNHLYSISGMAWLDSNKDGARDEDEEKISNLDVRLLNSNTGELIKDTKTDGNGGYQFSDLNEGNYIVMFEYDSLLYSITQYQKEGVNNTRNSDVVQKEKDGKIVAMSDNINITDTNISSIDAGFIKNMKFDLSLDKSISKVTVRSKAGTDEDIYNKSKLAKIEIGAKYIEGSMVVVEYEIEVKNEGEVQGYATDIVDYMPKDLAFSPEMNKDWFVGADGNLHSTSLADKVIKPGESRILTLVLTKQMTADNTGRSVNIAEIANAKNDLSIIDEDSVPGNRNDNEDDISKAELIISIRTGALFIAIGVIVAILSLIIVAYVIYKKRKKEE